ncbi:MAG: ParB/RepB/Spo0J family partition protein [Bacteriovoracaceae bacterium]|jgi:ParB family transcriptional regulator, chromosome partitioning protein|nr:ParB/RepB/Spo0J family partition protein [Bacteriovoracaceae bacterium]
MVKEFSPRQAKKFRKTRDISEHLDPALFRVSDEKLLKGARLIEVQLVNIIVKEQVRTKFNDSSIKDLAANIQTNGLIQPLVLHRTGSKYTLICGERRFRAMSTLPEIVKAPCFVLEEKTDQELMAIQFSENSSREELHYIDKADGIWNYQKTTRASERKITEALGISKSEVHRSLMIARMPVELKEAAKTYDIEKYVLLEWDAIEIKTSRKEVLSEILAGNLTKRSHLKSILKSGTIVKTGKKRTKITPSSNISAKAFIKAMTSTSKSMDLDPQTRKLLKNLVKETRDVVDL